MNRESLKQDQLDQFPLTAILNDPVMRHRYNQQKANADRRGIGFRMTYEMWLYIWLSSGFLDKRGKGAECYCMSRKDDVGDYVVGNVEIIPYSQNTYDAQIGRAKSRKHRAKLQAILNAIRPVKPVKADGEHFNSVSATARHYGVCNTTIVNRCLSSNKKWKGWKFDGVVS